MKLPPDEPDFGMTIDACGNPRVWLKEEVLDFIIGELDPNSQTNDITYVVSVLKEIKEQYEKDLVKWQTELENEKE